jgi:DNA-binding transcriptional regulator YdaS (Cro superfamily)
MNTPLERAIDQLGGQAALSRELGVSIQVVGNWLARGVPVARCPDIERVTAGAVRCEELCPDVDWAVLRRFPHKATRVAA